MNVFIIDSGLGGVSVLNKLKANFPNSSYCYFADDLNHPYGKRSKDEIVCLIKSILAELSPKKEDVVVIACNTASTSFFGLESEYPFKIVYVMPREKHFKKGERTLFLGTDLTCENLRGKLGKDVILKALEDLPTIIEEGDVIKIKREIFSLPKTVDADFDAVYLGCTHFSLFREYFNNAFVGKRMIDGAELVISDNRKELKKLVMPDDIPTLTYYSTSKMPTKLKLMAKFTK